MAVNQEKMFSDDQILVSRTDTRGIITYANEAFCEVAGYNEEDLIGKPHNIIRHPDMPSAAFKDLWDTVRAGRCWTGIVKNYTKDGGYYWVRANVSPEMNDQGVSGFISVRTKPTRQEVQSAESLYRQLKANQAKLPSTLGFNLINRISLYQALAWIGLMIAVPLGMNVAMVLGLFQDIPIVKVLAILMEAIPLIFLFSMATRSRHALERLQHGMKRMMQGHYDADLHLLRLDEFADVFTLANAMQYQTYFKVDEMRLMHKKANDAMAAKLAEQEAESKLVREFELKAQEVSSVLASSSEEVSVAASSLAATAEELTAQVGIVEEGSTEGISHVEMTAAATEEVSATIQDITDRVQKASEIADQGMVEAKNTNAIVSRLSQVSEEIGSVVNTINEIAEQTNLLALNASIEAARAGDAGRGFAVVANEVKDLAQQTAKATGDIGKQIAGMQAESGAVVKALEKISGIIAQINEHTGSVSEAMNQQAQAVAEISDGAQRASYGMNNVKSSIGDLGIAANDTGRMSSEMVVASEDLARIASEQQTMIHTFLNGLSRVRGNV
ncbi:MAG: PAS domain-containing protein [Zetaproteobacteria bacterium]|nr:PAS domain-containing protein [Zetaproteobacteria bacterium]